jgi:hypothetical protein
MWSADPPPADPRFGATPERGRWEHGSDFHLPRLEAVDARPDHPWTQHGSLLYGSGRHAIAAVLQFGRANRGWQRVWLPRYFCPEVIYAIVQTGVEVCTYADRPGQAFSPDSSSQMQPGDAILLVNFFGLRSAVHLEKVPPGVEIIEDHTHDLWSGWASSSRADWCVGSLRKLLPLPDGGVLWSPKGHRVPPNPGTATAAVKSASLHRLAAMSLKSLYLGGAPIDKGLFRGLAVEGEMQMADPEVSGITEWSEQLLHTLPVGPWRNVRRLNFAKLMSALEDIPWLRVLRPDPAADDACPLALIVVCDTPERRERVRAALIHVSVYPAVLWPLTPGAFNDPDFHLSQRLLALHCDMRYSTADLQRVADLVRVAGSDRKQQEAGG